MGDNQDPAQRVAPGVAGTAHTGDLSDPGAGGDAGDKAGQEQSSGVKLEKRFHALERAVIDGFYGGNRARYADEHGITFD